uniref:Peptidase M14 domain-containing protein n=2 Tax=Clastoptera arizonana TaxID=38151 RepID=A0A1B6E1Z2_9HEMI
MPIMNPDGYEYSHTEDRLWRKNRAPNKGTNCIGTDLNRNWGYSWGGRGTSTDPCAWNYAGKHPFSENETASVSKYLQNTTNLQGYMTFHSYGQFILFPWAHTYKRLPDYTDLLEVGIEIAKQINKTTGAMYKVGSTADKLYTASGGSDDWARGVGKIKYSFTVELQDKGDFGFLLPTEKIPRAVEDAFAAFEVLFSKILSN